MSSETDIAIDPPEPAAEIAACGEAEADNVTFA